VLVALAGATFLTAYIYQDELRPYYHKYLVWQFHRSLVNHGEALSSVDDVRLLRLDEQGASTTLGTYTVSLPGPLEMAIVAEKRLSGEEATKFAALWREMGLNDEGGGKCHQPHHVVQFRHKGRAVLDAIVCFDCANVAIPVDPRWMVAGFDEEKPYARFKVIMESHVGAHIRQATQ
jgi:hypothetical protein